VRFSENSPISPAAHAAGGFEHQYVSIFFLLYHFTDRFQADARIRPVPAGKARKKGQAARFGSLY